MYIFFIFSLPSPTFLITLSFIFVIFKIKNNINHNADTNTAIKNNEFKKIAKIEKIITNIINISVGIN